MNECIKVLLERRSCKKYTDKLIPNKELELILKCGMNAPSGMGKESPIMLVIQNKEKRNLLSKLNAQIMNTNIDPFYNAPTVIAVLADNTIPTYIEDGSLVIGNMLNAATSLGIDSCWIHRCKEVFERVEGKKLLQEYNIDTNKSTGIGFCILGYRDTIIKEGKTRKNDYITYIK